VVTAAGELAVLAEALRARVGDPARVRPFVCDGSPLACRAFVVGGTPATGMAGAFWRFWDADAGFRRADWLAAYAAERGERGPSATRRMLERIVAAAAPVSCLETDVYAPPPAGDGTGDGRSDAAVFDLLLERVRPRAILAHGRDAARHLAARLGGAALPADRFAAVPAPWGTVRVRAVPHLARRWSYADADALGRELAAAALAGDLDAGCGGGAGYAAAGVDSPGAKP
jgi:hypothetical protein